MWLTPMGMLFLFLRDGGSHLVPNMIRPTPSVGSPTGSKSGHLGGDGTRAPLLPEVRDPNPDRGLLPQMLGRSVSSVSGLRPYPAYMESGLDWLGRVPDHWEVRRLKGVAKILSGATSASGRSE